MRIFHHGGTEDTEEGQAPISKHQIPNEFPKPKFKNPNPAKTRWYLGSDRSNL
jgi:hypothetical protein